MIRVEAEALCPAARVLGPTNSFRRPRQHEEIVTALLCERQHIAAGRHVFRKPPAERTARAQAREPAGWDHEHLHLARERRREIIRRHNSR